MESGSPRTSEGREATELFNDVQLMKEMSWSYDDLLRTPEDVVWAAQQVLSETARREKDEVKKARRGR